MAPELVVAVLARAVPVVVLQAVAEVEQPAGPAEAVRVAAQVEPLRPASGALAPQVR